MWYNNFLTVLPNKNLISNIGFGEDVTHTMAENEFSNLTAENIKLPKHSQELVRNEEADKFTTKLMFSK